MSKNPYDILKERGFFAQVTDEEAVRKLLGTGSVKVYVGYDPTADSLHVGHLYTVMALKHLEDLGHVPVVVLGGGTARVGDPSGKTELRQMITAEAINANAAGMEAQISKLLDVEGGKSLVVDNSEWLMELSYIDFLRDIGRHFSVNRMLAAEAYKQRLERGLSFIEFNYQLLQAYDFLELLRRYDCRLQMGGDDQWGNILAGTELCRRVEHKEVEGLTFPLLMNAAGEKMGKTAGGAVWLDPERLSPYDYYQYWVNVHDDDLARLLGLFTFLPMPEIEDVKKLDGADLNAAKSILAWEATRFVHGEEEAQKAHAAAQGAFGGREIQASILPSSKVQRLSAANITEIPTTVLDEVALKEGVPIADLMVQGALADSKGAARRLVKQGAVRLGDEKVTDERYTVKASDLVDGEMILRAGKKKVHRFTL